MTDQGTLYIKQGLQLLQNGKHGEAIDFFNKAIELNPSDAAAYHHRGEAYLQLNDIVRGNTDIQKAKDIRSGKARRPKTQGPRVKISINDVDSIYDDVFTERIPDNEETPLEFDDSFYDSVFSDDVIESDEAWGGILEPSPKQDSFSAVLEFLGGDRQEVSSAILFQPTPNDISILRQDGYVERVYPLEQLACIRIAGLPAQYRVQVDDSCPHEIIETIDDSIFHEAIPEIQKIDNMLIGFSTKKKTRFTYTLIPKVNVKKRCQERYLGDILLEKKFIANDILKRALNEHEQEKNLKLGKILAQRTKILYSTIEEELEKARKNNVQGLKAGEILLIAGLVSEEQVLDALEHQEHLQNMRIGEFLIEKGIIEEKEVYMALADKFRTPFVDLRKQKVSKKILTCLPKELVLEHEVLPINIEDGTITVATPNPGISSLCETILKASKCKNVQCVLAQPTHLHNIIDLLYRKMGVGK